MGVTLTPVLTSPPVCRVVKGTNVKDPLGHFGRAYRAWFNSSFLSKSQMYSEDRMTIEGIQACVASRIVNTLDTVNVRAVCMAEEPKEHTCVHLRYVYVHYCKLAISLAALVAFMCYPIFLSLPPPCLDRVLPTQPWPAQICWQQLRPVAPHTCELNFRRPIQPDS